MKELNAKLIEKYGDQDRRIKDLGKKNAFAIDDRRRRGHTGHCFITAYTTEAGEVRVSMSGEVPLSSMLTAWAESRGEKWPFDLRFGLSETAKAREFADALRKATARGAPRFEEPTMFYEAPRIAATLDELADVVDEFVGERTARTSTA